MAKYKAVLLDFDGTIMNTNELIFQSWQHVYRTVEGRDIVPDEVTPTYGEPLFDTMAARFPDRDPNEMVDIYRDFQRYMWKEPVLMFPGTEEMINGLKERGLKVCLVTSRFWASTKQGLYKFDIGDKFDDKVTAEDTTVHKPDPEPCYVALRKLGITADEALFIGDSKFDIMCAHNAGIKACLVGWTVCMPESERVGIKKPDFIIEKPEDIYKIVE